MSNDVTTQPASPLERADELLKAAAAPVADADRRLRDLRRERGQLAERTAAVDHAIAFEVEKLEALASTVRAADLSKRLAALPLDDTLRKLAAHAAGGWEAMQRAGATDQQILERVGKAWGYGQTEGTGPTLGTAYGFRHSSAPFVSFPGRELLKGDELAAELRRVLEIPKPTAAAAMPTKDGKPKPTRRPRRPRRASGGKATAAKRVKLDEFFRGKAAAAAKSTPPATKPTTAAEAGRMGAQAAKVGAMFKAATAAAASTNPK